MNSPPNTHTDYAADNDYYKLRLERSLERGDLLQADFFEGLIRESEIPIMKLDWYDIIRNFIHDQ